MSSAVSVPAPAGGYFAFWGKARPVSDDTPGWHPLAYHCLDVAAAAEALLGAWPVLAERLGRLLALSPEDLRALLVLLAALHDLGKFSRQFQCQVPELSPFGDCAQVPPHPRHDHAGLTLWQHVVRPMLGIDKDDRALRPLIAASVAHHGEPVDIDKATRDPVAPLGAAARAAVRAFAGDLHAILPLPASLPGERGASASAQALAGLFAAADWLGSNQAWFPYRAATPDLTLERYWHDVARPGAAKAIPGSGVVPALVAPLLTQEDLIGPGAAPTPMQAWAAEIALPPGPSLFVIEDATGSGKTEAAIRLAHRLMAAGRASGLYMALPTQATANQMFERMAALHRRLFGAAERPSVALAHGKRELHSGFRAARFAAGREEAGYEAPRSGAGEPDATASAQCAAWIADDRRLSFLADIGAGTIDQALLAVLASRHHALRLVGLAQRVLVVDEVHAYDAYVARELGALLEFHAALGGDAVLLSATLPTEMRQDLVARFRKGAGRSAAGTGLPASTDYPLASVWSPGHAEARAVAVDPRMRRRVGLLRVASPDLALEEVRAAAEAGHAVAYIRNSVADVMQAADALADLDPVVFHARFALADRLAREAEVVAAYGRRSGQAERRAGGRGRVLIASQVVEQSLDLDFDVMLTDLAPVDLVIQRAGRLWRHRRPEREGAPVLRIVSPDPAGALDEAWYRRMFARGAKVYPDHGRLWLSAAMLFGRGALVTPDDMRPMVEHVYGPEAEAAVPAVLRRSMLKAAGERSALGAFAGSAVLKVSDGYNRLSERWDDDARVQTRAGAARVTLRLAVIEGGRILPWSMRGGAMRGGADRGGESGEVAPWEAWRLSEVDVPPWQVAAQAKDQGVPADAIAAVKDTWSRYEKETALAILRPEGEGTWGGLGADAKGADVPLAYATRWGLRRKAG